MATFGSRIFGLAPRERQRKLFQLQLKQEPWLLVLTEPIAQSFQSLRTTNETETPSTVAIQVRLMSSIVDVGKVYTKIEITPEIKSTGLRFFSDDEEKPKAGVKDTDTKASILTDDDIETIQDELEVDTHKKETTLSDDEIEIMLNELEELDLKNNIPVEKPKKGGKDKHKNDTIKSDDDIETKQNEFEVDTNEKDTILSDEALMLIENEIEVMDLKNKQSVSSNDDDDDPFGVNFDDSLNRLGPVLPPKYKRDSVSGRFTGDIEREITEHEKRLLNADPITVERELLNRVIKGLADDDTTNGKNNPAEALNQLGQRIRESDMGLNVLGRSVKSQSAYEVLDDGTKLGRDSTGFTQPLTSEEFTVFSQYMQKEHGKSYDSTRSKIPVVTEEDIPVLQTANQRISKNRDDDPDDLELSLKWLTTRAQRQMDDDLDDNPFSELMPHDLNPSRLVNRNRAKIIPIHLLHHNNVQLLLQFLTPTGQIRNRIQTRLGARDQRRVSKLIRRARSLGLLPYIGQCKVERHGWVNAPDIHEVRDWEEHLIERGLTVRRSKDKVGDKKL